MQFRKGDIVDNRYQIEQHIGSGGFADVFRAKDQLTNTTIAIKIYNSMDKHGIDIFLQEYQSVSSMNHQRLLRAQHFGVFEGSPYLIMPYCKNGSLTRLLVDKNFILTERQLVTILLQVTEGLEYLHQKGVVHQDIKPDNILELEDEEYVLSDFGISQRARSTLMKSVRRTKKMDNSGSGYTPAYAPPLRERLSTRPDPSKDIFSLGATMYELAAKVLPYTDMGEAVQNNLEIPDLEHGYTKGWNEVLQSCLVLNPEDRPTATELKKKAHLFLGKGVWELPKKGKSFSSPKEPRYLSSKKPIPSISYPAFSTWLNQLPQNKKGWFLSISVISVFFLLIIGITQISSGGKPEVKPNKNIQSEESLNKQKRQKEYDDLIFNAEGRYIRKKYKEALKKFQSAKGLVFNDQKAIDGIRKCKQKILELENEKQQQLAIASFETPAGTFTDNRDGQTYNWARMDDGNIWMTENLNYAIEGSTCYDEDELNCNKYGRLYTWDAARETCEGLGNGWRLPTDQEWKDLANSYGGYYDQEYEEIVGEPKEGYKNLIKGGSSGFNALLGGLQYSNGSFSNLELNGLYWINEKEDIQNTYNINFYGRQRGLNRSGYFETSVWRSCRCINH